MVWKTISVEDQKMRFIAMVLEGERSFAEICREFGISRQCGYKWLKRYKEEGMRGLQERSRKPLRCINETPAGMVCEIMRLRQSHAGWGGKKIRRKLTRKHDKVPSARTIDRILERCGFIAKRIRRRRKPARKYQELIAKEPNDIMTVDLKGWWRVKDGTRVEPLTIRDEASKFIFVAEPLKRHDLESVKRAFIGVFEDYGLPLYIRCDNGTPWAFHRGLCGLTRLSVWWMSLGITPLFTPRGQPQANGSHERMHKDIADELERTPAPSFLEEKARLVNWRWEFNHERPHEKLDGKYPSEVYKASPRKFSPIPSEYVYPENFQTRKVKVNGKVSWRNKEFFLSKAFAHQTVAFEIVSGKKMNIWYRDFCLAYTSPDFSAPLVEYNLLTMKPEIIKKLVA